MCTSFLTACNGIAVNLRHRVAIAVTAPSTIERLIDSMQVLTIVLVGIDNA
jgi:hypothetical protein